MYVLFSASVKKTANTKPVYLLVGGSSTEPLDQTLKREDGGI